jgi:hypothetical protein
VACRPSKAYRSSMSAAPRPAASRCLMICVRRRSGRGRRGLWLSALPGWHSTPAGGDWHLRSALLDPAGTEIVPLYAPGVPLYEAYAGVLRSLNRHAAPAYWRARGRRSIGQRRRERASKGDLDAHRRNTFAFRAGDLYDGHRIRCKWLARCRRASTECCMKAEPAR